MDLPDWIAEDRLSRREALADYRALISEGVDVGYRFWAERWRWDRNKAHRFIRRVLEEGLEQGGESPIEGQLGLALPGVPKLTRGSGESPENGPAWPARSKLKRKPGGDVIYPDAFEEIWSAYSLRYHKANKKTSYNHVRASILSGATVEQIMKGTESYIEEVEDDDQFGYAAHNFFGNEVWDSDPERDSDPIGRGFY